MIYISFEIAAILAECLITIMFLTEYFSYKNSEFKNVKFFAGVSGLFVIDYFIANADDLGAIALFSFALFGIIYNIIFLRGKSYLKILFPIGMVMSIVLINLSVMYSFGLITGNYQTSNQDYEHYSRIVCLVFSKLLYFLLSRLILSTKNNKYHFTKTEWAYISVFFGISFFVSVTLWKNSVESTSEQLINYSIFYSGIIFLNIFLYYLLLKLNKGHIERTQNALQIQKLSSQKITIESIKTRYNEMRTLKHDVGNLLTSIAVLAEKGDSEEILKSIEKISNEKLNNGNYIVFTDAPLIDAVINAKSTACKKKGVEFECNIATDLSSLDELDVSIILSNLFDNAIEYSEKISDGKIMLSISKINSYIYIDMKNKITEPILTINGKLKTTKTDGKNHGIGINSIKDIVKKLGGEIRFSDIDGYFNVDIFIKA